MARPPSTAYRVAKFVRRNQLMVTAGSAVAAALVMGLGVSTRLYFQEQHARRRAVTAEQAQSQLRQQAETNANKARAEARKSEQIALFLKTMLKGVGPSAARGRDTAMLNEILDKTAERVGTDFKDTPEVEAELRTTLGDVYDSIYQSHKAAEMHRRALALNRQLYGKMSTNVADSLEKLGHAIEGQEEERERLYVELLTIRTNLLGPEHVQVADALCDLGEVRLATQRIAEAETLFRGAWLMKQKLGGTNSTYAARCLARLSQSLFYQGKVEEAEAPARQSVVILERLGSDEQHLGWTRGNLGRILFNLNKLDEAETSLRSAVTIERRLLGPDSILLAGMTDDLAQVLGQKGKLEEAEKVAREAVALSRKMPSDESRDWNVTYSLATLGRVLDQQGRLAEAESALRESVTNAARLFPKYFVGWRNYVYLWLSTLRHQGKQAEAFRALEDLLRQESLGPSWQHGLLEARANLSGHYRKWKEAAADYTRLIEAAPTNHWFYHQLAPMLLISGELGAYRQLCQRILTRFSSAKEPWVADRMSLDCLLLPPSEADLPTVRNLVELASAATTDPLFSYYQTTRALAEYRQGRFAEAVQWAQASLAATEEAPERDARAYLVLAMAQHRLKHAEQARAALAKAVEITETKLSHLDSEDLGHLWNDVLIAHIELREARELLNSE